LLQLTDQLRSLHRFSRGHCVIDNSVHSMEQVHGCKARIFHRPEAVDRALPHHGSQVFNHDIGVTIVRFKLVEDEVVQADGVKAGRRACVRFLPARRTTLRFQRTVSIALSPIPSDPIRSGPT